MANFKAIRQNMLQCLVGFILATFVKQGYTTADPVIPSTATDSLAPRISAVRLPLPVHDAGVALSSIECPTDRCFCQFNSTINRNKLNCRYQRLGEIPKFSLVDTVFYEITFRMENYITEIPSSAFQNLKVEKIDLLSNSLVSIQPGAFSGLETYLTELLIEGNGNIPPPYTKISNLINLRRLRLQKFQQHTIDQNNYFDRFPNLEVLQLYEFVSLSSIDGFAFNKKLQNLQRLEVIGSSLTSIPVQSLIHLQSLKMLYIRDSRISAVYSRSFEDMRNLTNLDLSYNKITNLDTDAFQGIDDRLEVLDLAFNELNPESMVALSSKSWSQLEQLTLSYNSKLESMPQQVFKSMPKMQYLNLCQINLQKITKDLFVGLKNLHTLDLSWNKIEAIEAGAFEYMTTLHELKLNSQYGPTPQPSFAMHISPEAFQGSGTSLAILNLQYTPIVPEQFWNVIKTLTNLQTLKLSRTGLSSLPDFGFIHNTKLQEIELEYNNIKTLTPDSFTGPTDSLQRLFLNYNNISLISSCVFKNHVKLESVCLAQNPLNCDCKLYWLYKIVRNHTFPVGPCYHQDFICSIPQQFENQALHEVPLKDTCTKSVPDTCIHKSVTTITTTTVKKVNNLTLEVVGKTTNSVKIIWNIKDRTEVIGFILEYHATTKNHTVRKQLHQDRFFHSVTNLKSGLFYRICITAIINQTDDKTMRACRMTQADSIGFDTHEKDISNDDMKIRNIIIGVVVGTVTFVILVFTALYQVVKYKIRKLNSLRSELKHPSTHPLTTRDTDMADGAEKAGIVGNEYIQYEKLNKEETYHTIEETDFQNSDGVVSINVASDYNGDIGEDKEETKIPISDTKSQPDYPEADFLQRHISPPELNAKDICTEENVKRTSRALPLIPLVRQASRDL